MALDIPDLDNGKRDLDHIAAVATSEADTAIDRLGRVKRTLQGVITYLLNLGLIAISGLAGYVFRGNFASGTAYAPKDIYRNTDGVLYVVLAAHTASTVTVDAAAGRVAVYQSAGGVVLANNYATLAEANAAAVSANKPLAFLGVLNVTTPTTITAPIVDSLYQLFSPTSQVTIDNGMPVRPEWFGAAAGNIRLAVTSLPTPKGGVVQLALATYPPSYDVLTGAMVENGTGVAGFNYLAKPNVFLRGARLPTYAADNSRLENGSIVQGAFYVFATGFQVDEVGFDSGVNVVNALYGGVAVDAFAHVQINKAAPTYATGVVIGRIRGLGNGPDGAHGVLIEACDGPTVEYAEGRMAYHGVVIKSKNARGGSLIGIGTHGDGVIFKSDAYANMRNVTFANVVGTSAGASIEAGFGMLVEAVGAPGGDVQIANLIVEKKVGGYCARNNGAQLGNVNVGNFISNDCTTGYQMVGGIVRASIATATINSSTNGVYVDDLTQSRSNHIGRLDITNGDRGIYALGKLAVDSLETNTLTNEAIYYAGTLARVSVGQHSESTVGAVHNLTPAFAGTWVNHFGGELFNIDLRGSKVVLAGLIRGGTGNLIMTLPVQIRPLAILRFICLGYDGTNFLPIEVSIGTDGGVYASNYSLQYLSLAGVSWPAPF